MGKNKFIKYICTGVLFFMLPASSSALDELEGTQGDRFILERVDKKFVRLDKETGQISVCEFSAENLICRMAADDRDALVDELTNLQNRIATIEDSNAKSLPDMEPNKVKPKKDIPNADKESNDKALDNAVEEKLDAEFEDALKYSNKVMRRFFEVMKKLRTDFENDY